MPERQADPCTDCEVAGVIAALEGVAQEPFDPPCRRLEGDARPHTATERELRGAPPRPPEIEQVKRYTAGEVRRADEVARPGAALELVQHVQPRRPGIRQPPSRVERE